MTSYFLLHTTLEYVSHQQEEGVVWLEELMEAFPRSAFVKCERALVLYHARGKARYIIFFSATSPLYH